MKKFGIFLMLALSTSSCANLAEQVRYSLFGKQLTPEEKAKAKADAEAQQKRRDEQKTKDDLEYQEAAALPAKFTIPKSEAIDAWARAQVFVQKWSAMKLQIATDAVLETYNPTIGDYHSRFGYSITKTPLGDDVEIEIHCTSNTNDTTSEQINDHIAALFIKTGKLATEGRYIRSN